MNILDLYKMNNFFNKYFGFSLPASKMVVAKCLKLIWNHSRITSGTYFSPFQGVSHLYRGLRRAPKPYFGLILEYWIIFLFFSEWIFFWISWTLLNEYFFWMNILDFVLNWIESFLGPIQWKNEFSKRIGQGYFCTSHVFGKKNTGIYFLRLKYIPARKSGGVGGSETRRITGSVPNGCLLTAPAILKHFAFHKI